MKVELPKTSEVDKFLIRKNSPELCAQIIDTFKLADDPEEAARLKNEIDEAVQTGLDELADRCFGELGEQMCQWSLEAINAGMSPEDVKEHINAMHKALIAGVEQAELQRKKRK